VSDWLMGRGYLVALPLRRGYGATGGPWAESYGACSDPNYYRAGMASASDIGHVLAALQKRPDVRPGRALIVGSSAGGWGSIAIASTNPKGLLAVINFAGGRGGNQPGVGNCGPQRLVEAAARFGRTSRIPSLWLYSTNDRSFEPRLSRQMFAAFINAGGVGQYVLLPSFGSDGHRIFASNRGIGLWRPPVETFLSSLGARQ
jgi:dienelactone hydrolase